jgi:hypothetical protein
MAGVIALLLLAPAAGAEPGTPGVSAAQVGVYGQSGVGGQTIGQTPSQGQLPGQGSGPTAGKEQGADAGAPAEAQTQASVGKGGLPFTGFLAAAVLGVGLLLLAGGALLRSLATFRRSGAEASAR